MSRKLLADAFDGMERARDSADLRAQMEKFALQLGFDRFAYALTISAPSFKTQHYALNGFPPQWADRYIGQDYFRIDPLIRHAAHSTLPALWDDAAFRQESSREFWEEAASFGLNSGLTLAVHDRPGVTGVFSLARDQTMDVEGDELAALIGRAQLFASLLHHAVCRVDLPALLPEATADLTGRERECLKWSAEGKTAWEISRILGIAERTAVFHLNNCVQKLGATNKSQAIVRAVALRLVW